MVNFALILFELITQTEAGGCSGLPNLPIIDKRICCSSSCAPPKKVAKSSGLLDGLKLMSLARVVSVALDIC